MLTPFPVAKKRACLFLKSPLRRVSIKKHLLKIGLCGFLTSYMPINIIDETINRNTKKVARSGVKDISG